MKITVLAALSGTLVLTACAFQHVTPETAPQLADGELCGYIQYHGKQDTMIALGMMNTRDAVKREISKRKLDCSVGHSKCESYGLKKGTRAYADCRMKVEQQEHESRERRFEWDTLKGMFEQKQRDDMYRGMMR